MHEATRRFSVGPSPSASARVPLEWCPKVGSRRGTCRPLPCSPAAHDAALHVGQKPSPSSGRHAFCASCQPYQRPWTCHGPSRMQASGTERQSALACCAWVVAAQFDFKTALCVNALGFGPAGLFKCHGGLLPLPGEDLSPLLSYCDQPLPRPPQPSPSSSWPSKWSALSLS